MTSSVGSYNPIVVIEDRYRGAYSGGTWFAVSGASRLVDEVNTRAQFCLMSETGPSSGDIEAAAFWIAAPDWIAIGSTPDEAVEALGRLRPASEAATTTTWPQGF